MPTSMRFLFLFAGLVMAGCDGGQGPAISARFLSAVELKATLTDDTVKERILRPCDRMGFFPLGPGWRQLPRTVLVESIVVSRGGETIHEYDRETIEGVAEGHLDYSRDIILDESGYRVPSRLAWRCATLVSVLDTPVRAEFHYGGGETWTAVWEPCEVNLWESVLGRTGVELPSMEAQRLVVTQGGEVVHDFDRKAIKTVFWDYLHPRFFTVLYVVDKDGFRALEYPKESTGHPVPQCETA